MTWVGVTVLILGIIVVAAIRLRLLAFPFERDEGEYAYMGQLMLQGTPPYQIAYNMKLPGTYAAYAVVMALFGQTIEGVHLGLLILNALSAILVYLVSRFLMSPLGSGIAGTAFLMLSVCPSVLGLAAHATHFVTFFALGGTLLLLHALKSDKPLLLLFSGICFGMAVLMKQAGFFFGLFAGLYLIYAVSRNRPVNWRRLQVQAILLFSGALAPIALAFLTLYLAGVFETFWFWAVSYAAKYAGIVSPADGWGLLKENFPWVAAGAPLFWLLGGAGTFLLFFHRRLRSHAVFLCGFILFSFFAVCPGFYFRGHYWIVFLPALSMMAGAGASVCEEWLSAAWKHPRLSAILPVLILLAAIGQMLHLNRLVLLQLPPTKACRAVYGANPFPESLPIARFIQENCAPDATIAVLGSEPQIPFYARRRLATGYIYTYALMEPQSYALQMQKEMIQQIEAAKPAYLVFVNIPTSWLATTSSEKFLFNWLETYIENEMEQIGFADLISDIVTEYHLGDWEGKYSQPRSQFSVMLFKRKTDS